MLVDAIAAGELLIEAKARLRHGGYIPFVRRCGVSPRSAQLYTRLAREKRNVALLEADSIRAALKALAKPERKPAPIDFGPDGAIRLAEWQRREWRRAMGRRGSGA
jgi:hypothetical protein